MNIHTLGRIFSTLRKTARAWRTPSVTQIAARGRPFEVLISTVISLRTKDAVTLAASKRLFRLARTPKTLLRLSSRQIEQALYPAAFYRTKTRQIQAIARILEGQFGSRVPARLEDLLELPGVGRKTANLVLTEGFGLPGICVDTHVHRITNRWGWLQSRTPDKTEMLLRQVLPKEHWKEINTLLVALGQNICRPVSPWCSRCPIAWACQRCGVENSR